MAGFFPEEWLEQLRQRSDLVSVVQRYVPLQQKNRRYWGCCPFHAEKTPSFSVNPDMQMYYCFGCKAAGNVFGFVMAAERMDFYDAVKLLADWAGMPLPQMDERGQKEYREKRLLKDQLMEANLEAARFFRDQLMSPAGRQALDYLHRRGISDGTIRRFGLGFAPDDWQALIDHAQSKSIPKERLVQAGLAIKNDKGRIYDAFRNRVMFPIITAQGKVIGFGGRVMDDSLPKYLNSPETPVFNKRANLFALNLVKRQQSLDRLILMEGYMDVISVTQQGVVGAVASLGTSLTPDQAKLIKRYTDQVLLSYDGDSAGQHAALRGLDILSKAGLEVKVLSLPGGMDPDEYIRKYGREGWDEAVSKAMTLPEFKMHLAAAQYDRSTLEGRTKYAIVAARIIAAVANPVEREIYLKRLQTETAFSMESLISQVENGKSDAVLREETEKAVPEEKQTREDENAWRLLRVLASRTDGFGFVYDELTEQDFSQELQKRIYSLMKEDPALSPAALIDQLPEEEQSGAAAQLVQAAEDEDTDKYVHDLVDTIKKTRLDRRLAELNAQLEQVKEIPEKRRELLLEISAVQKERRELLQ